jgi:hypothetical protein
VVRTLLDPDANADAEAVRFGSIDVRPGDAVKKARALGSSNSVSRAWPRVVGSYETTCPGPTAIGPLAADCVSWTIGYAKPSSSNRAVAVAVTVAVALMLKFLEVIVGRIFTQSLTSTDTSVPRAGSKRGIAGDRYKPATFVGVAASVATNGPDVLGSDSGSSGSILGELEREIFTGRRVPKIVKC